MEQDLLSLSEQEKIKTQINHEIEIAFDFAKSGEEAVHFE